MGCLLVSPLSLILGDPFGLVVTVIPVVGAIIGAISCLVRIDLAKNEVNRLNNKKYRSHVRVIVKSIISILVYVFIYECLFSNHCFAAWGKNWWLICQ